MISHEYAVAVLVVLGACCYFNSLDCGFVFDDASAIKDNKDLRPATPISQLFFNDFWGTPMHKEKSHKSYRPLCVLTFRWNYAWSELNATSYHLVNVLLHIIVCVSYYRVCQLFVSNTCSFLAAILFTVHPIHTEAVTGVVGRAELLSSILYLGALFTYHRSTDFRAKTRWRYLFSTILQVSVSVLCKEQGITIIGVCCIYEVFVAQKMTVKDLLEIIGCYMKGQPFLPRWLRDAVIRCVVLVMSTLMLLVARIKVMGAKLPVFTNFDNPASVADSPARQLTLNYLLPVNGWLLLNPDGLCCDWTMGTIPLIRSILDQRNLATLAFYFIFLQLVYYAVTHKGARSRAVIMALSLIVLPFIPASNLFFPVGFVVAERILYAPSMGFCLLVALGFDLITNHKRSLQKMLWLVMGLLVACHSAKTVIRNYDWESEYSLFKAALRVNQQNAKLFNNVGHALESSQQWNEALKYFTEAARVQPDDIGAHINVGRTYNNMEMFTEAEQAYRTALDLLPAVKPGQSYTTRIAPNHLNVFLNLGNLLAKDESRLLEADSLLRTAISMRADYTQAYINRGDIMMKLHRPKDAQQQYELALRYEDDNPDIYYNMGVVLIEQSQQSEALKYFNKALQLDPDHKQTLFNSAVLMQELQIPALRPEAFKRLRRLEKVDSDNEKIYFNLAMLSMDDQQYENAVHLFQKAIELQPDFRSALFNIALMLVNNLDRPLDAIPHLKQLLQYYPEHSKGLILMGDININHVKDIDAAELNFLSILSREPDNVQANHNLCVVYVEQNKLREAESCLQKTIQLAPTETYIQKHLAIVQNRIQQVQNHKKKQAQSNEGG